MTARLPTFSSGDNPELADKIVRLVLEGKKTATAWPASEGQKTAIGRLWTMLDGAGRPRAVIEISLRRFDEVDAAFAFDGGDVDRSLEAWAAYRRYFRRRAKFRADMDV